MAEQFVLRQNDTASVITGVLRDQNDDPVDIASATIKFRMTPADGGDPKVDATAANDQNGDGSDGSKGNVSYEWQAADTDTPGYYLADWTVTYSGGKIQAFPNATHILVQVTADEPVAETTRFANSADLQDWLGVELTAAEHVRAAKLLADATGLVQKAARQTISRVTNDELTRPGAYADRIRLPERPVVSVSEVELDGVTLVADDEWYLDGDELVRTGVWAPSEDRFATFGGGWGDPSQVLVVTYTHGFDPIPETVKAICLQAVARVWTNPAMVQQENYGPMQTMYLPGQGLLLTDHEIQAVRQAVGRTAASTVLR
jgi:hypothetical protein